ncbi:hypothetical protein J4418_02570 [Candidatus Woesearchaeota archaeon]|nr:hypothetical protein [Candidatus Woesearchaeota archaeon]
MNDLKFYMNVDSASKKAIYLKATADEVIEYKDWMEMVRKLQSVRNYE